MPTLEIRKVLVCSTAHVTEATSKWLDSDDCQIACYKYEYGWFLPILVGLDPWADMPGKIPDELRGLYATAIKNECSMVQLDCDADEIDGLPTWEW